MKIPAPLDVLAHMNEVIALMDKDDPAYAAAVQARRDYVEAIRRACRPSNAGRARGHAVSAVDGTDTEARAAAMEDAATRLAGLLGRLAAEENCALDSRAVFLALSRTAEQVRLAAGHLRQQDWLSFADEDEPDLAARWSKTLGALDKASRLFEEIADGWI